MWKRQLIADVIGVRSAPVITPPSKAFGPCTYQLLAGADAFLADLHLELSRAISRVDMQFYTFECDSVGKPIADSLLQLNGNGVDVRLMVDDYINLAHNDKYMCVPRLDRRLQRSIVDEWRATNRLLKNMRAEGVRVKMTNQLTWLYLNGLHRDHRKLVVIDGDIPEKAVAYIGAINPSEHNAAWNDFMVKMTGDMIPAFLEDYELTWNDANPGGFYPYSDGLVMAEAYGFPAVIPAAKSLVRRARHRVVLESAYLWGEEMLSALVDATRTAEVSVIVPLHNHKRLYTLSRRALARLSRRGVNIHLLDTPDGMTHARALLVDGHALIGSNAFNGFLSGVMGELNLVTDNPSMVEQLDGFLTNDIRRSIKL